MTREPGEHCTPAYEVIYGREEDIKFPEDRLRNVYIGRSPFATRIVNEALIQECRTQEFLPHVLLGIDIDEDSPDRILFLSGSWIHMQFVYKTYGIYSAPPTESYDLFSGDALARYLSLNEKTPSFGSTRFEIQCASFLYARMPGETVRFSKEIIVPGKYRYSDDDVGFIGTWFGEESVDAIMESYGTGRSDD